MHVFDIRNFLNLVAIIFLVFVLASMLIASFQKQEPEDRPIKDMTVKELREIIKQERSK